MLIGKFIMEIFVDFWYYKDGFIILNTFND